MTRPVDPLENRPHKRRHSDDDDGGGEFSEANFRKFLEKIKAAEQAYEEEERQVESEEKELHLLEELEGGLGDFGEGAAGSGIKKLEAEEQQMQEEQEQVEKSLVTASQSEDKASKGLSNISDKEGEKKTPQGKKDLNRYREEQRFEKDKRDHGFTAEGRKVQSDSLWNPSRVAEPVHSDKKDDEEHRKGVKSGTRKRDQKQTPFDIYASKESERMRPLKKEEPESNVSSKDVKRKSFGKAKNFPGAADIASKEGTTPAIGDVTEDLSGVPAKGKAATPGAAPVVSKDEAAPVISKDKVAGHSDLSGVPVKGKTATPGAAPVVSKDKVAGHSDLGGVPAKGKAAVPGAAPVASKDEGAPVVGHSEVSAKGRAHPSSPMHDDTKAVKPGVHKEASSTKGRIEAQDGVVKGKKETIEAKAKHESVGHKKVKAESKPDDKKTTLGKFKEEHTEMTQKDLGSKKSGETAKTKEEKEKAKKEVELSARHAEQVSQEQFTATPPSTDTSNVSTHASFSPEPTIEQMNKVHETILQEASQMRNDEVSQVSIQINAQGTPLDKVVVSIELHKYRPYEVNITFKGVSNDAMNAINKHKSRLRATLKDKNINVHQMSIDVRGVESV